MNLSATGQGLDGAALEAIADRRLTKKVAELVGLNPRTQTQETWDFIVFVRDRIWTVKDRSAGIEIDAVVEARPELYDHWIAFKTWVQDSYDWSDAKQHGFTVEALLVSREAYAEFLAYTNPPPPQTHREERQTRRVVTEDDRGTKGSEIVHLSRNGEIGGHPYQAKRLRSVKSGLICKEVRMSFPEACLFGWKVGATKYSDGRQVDKTAVSVNPQTGGHMRKKVQRVRLKELFTASEAC